ncbi:SlyX family protein [Herminiimonas sp.]|uniref:SlyX family protein n=1 Tax=Herminiimonas sp. TaxID=1926289 RepID=UPI002723B677|nr:SlyX family protein [Herminiimonas sp.]MDO8306699.1 SlyX family protein [Herminiimonas sp.]
MNEERIVDIEIKLTRQEDLVDALNQMVYQQQKKLDELEAWCVALTGRLKEIASGGNEQGAAHEPPPHY